MVQGIRRILLLLALAAAAPAGLRAEDREATATAPKTGEAVDVMWRFDGGGRFPNIHPPAEWGSDRNILWKTPVEVGGYSSPVVAGGRVYVTAEMGGLICLDLADGKVLWKKDLFSKDSKDIPADLSKQLMRGCGGESKQSTPTPTSNGERVFSINAMGLCSCYDRDGNRQWIRIVETARDEEHFSSSPIFVGDKILLSWGCLLALNARDGKTLWKAADALPTHGTPAITKIGGEEVAVTPAGDVVRLADGAVLCAGLFESVYTTPLIENGVLYVIDSDARALELPARAEKGVRPKELWRTKLRGTFMASPVYRDGLLYTVECQTSRLHILDAKTGEDVTSAKIEGLAPAKNSYASPAAADKNVFFFDDAGNAAVLELGRQYRPVRVNKLEDACVGTPFFVGDRIIIRGSRTVYCIGEGR
jgi:outer membrane protein assembly factor BamB